MPGRSNRPTTPRQLTGSEYSGVETTKATIQPQPADVLTPGEILRLDYLTGQHITTEGIEDRRAMMGLSRADGRRPLWLTNTGVKSEAERQGLVDE